MTDLLSDMKKSLMWLRGAREMLGLPVWSESAECVYFDTLSRLDDEAVLAGLKVCLRLREVIPSPHELRKVMDQIQDKGTSHG